VIVTSPVLTLDPHRGECRHPDAPGKPFLCIEGLSSLGLLAGPAPQRLSFSLSKSSTPDGVLVRFLRLRRRWLVESPELLTWAEMTRFLDAEGLAQGVYCFSINSRHA